MERQNSGSSRRSMLQGLIDAHAHVWTDDLDHYRLASEFTPSDMIPRAAPPDAILADARLSGVDRAVLVQMSYYGCDNSYMLDVIRCFGGVFRGIAVVDSHGNRPDEEMRRLARRGIRGFRIYAEGKSDASYLASGALDRMFECGQRERLALCLLLLPEGLDAVRKCCERFPETPVIIDHLGQVGVSGEIITHDAQQLCALSIYPEVKVKISAFYALGAKRPPHDDLVPLIRQVYYAFGPKRLMWGSDWPFQVAQETYEDSISLIRDHLNFLSCEDKDWILRKTAEATFFA
jgi:predicted TIM-barrel fold metal-dependent hydrolase